MKIRTVAKKNLEVINMVCTNNAPYKVLGVIAALENGSITLEVNKEYTYVILDSTYSGGYSNTFIRFTTDTVERFTNDFVVFKNQGKVSKSKLKCIFRGN